ncbi:hypothetical protein N2152v2_006119 [Parachlorella kessleri]
MLSQEFSRALGGNEVDTVHIMLGLIAEEPQRTGGFLGSGVTVERARSVVENMVGKKRPRDSSKDLPFSRDAKKIFELALVESKRMGMSFIAPEHICLAVLSGGSEDSRRLLARLGLDTDRLQLEAAKRLKGEAESEGAAAAAASAARRKPVASGSDKRSSGDDKTQVLDEFCRDLCKAAKEQRTDPVIGREREVLRMTQILARRSKNNPILLGEPGVGKTAIAEGLARAIVQRVQPDGTPLPEFLHNKRVMQLDVGLLIAGAKERGELESRVTKLLGEVKKAGNVILVIDEVHTLVGAGSVSRGGGGGLDIANLLKPALARGELQCIGATTLDEHRKYIEKDAALERRFQPIMVGEPTEPEALQILEGLQERYERHHRCVYDSAALEAAVTLSSRYVADRYLPDKAIDLLDEAGSRVRIATYNALRGQGGNATDLAATSYQDLAQVMDAKEEAVQELLFEEASLLRSRELELKSKLSGLPGEGPVVPVVTVEHIEEVVSAWTGIPVERMSQDEKARLASLADVLKEHVIGQEEAIGSTARAMVRAQSGLKDPHRPIAALMFAGPTGVGKTELTKKLSEHYFGSAGSMIRLDMSEYMERHTVSKLIGAPPGYVGFGEGGKLTEAVRRRPFSVVLFDEIEKAHPDVFNVLLQVIEDGRLTDSQGRTVSFKNTLIILTTNVGSSVIAKGGAGIGFELRGEAESAEQAKYSRIRGLVMEELKSYFRPELLNRLDEVVVFRQLGEAEIRVIAGLELAKTAARVEERGISLEVSDAVMSKLVAEGVSEEWGARQLRRTVTRLVEDPLCEAILSEQVVSGEVAWVDVNDQGEVVVRNKAHAAQATQVVYTSA